jgi:hypothetical protein
MEYFKKGEIVYLINTCGEDFKVKILDRFYDHWTRRWYYVVAPVEFESFNREVACIQCYKKS